MIRLQKWRLEKLYEGRGANCQLQCCSFVTSHANADNDDGDDDDDDDDDDDNEDDDSFAMKKHLQKA